jgi:hypothetical protein
MSMRTLSSAAGVHPVPVTAPAINGKLPAWTIFAGVLVVAAICAIAVSPPYDVDSIVMMSLIGP